MDHWEDWVTRYLKTRLLLSQEYVIRAAGALHKGDEYFLGKFPQVRTAFRELSPAVSVFTTSTAVTQTTAKL